MLRQVIPRKVCYNTTRHIYICDLCICHCKFYKSTTLAAMKAHLTRVHEKKRKRKKK